MTLRKATRRHPSLHVWISLYQSMPLERKRGGRLCAVGRRGGRSAGLEFPWSHARRRDMNVSELIVHWASALPHGTGAILPLYIADHISLLWQFFVLVLCFPLLPRIS